MPQWTKHDRSRAGVPCRPVVVLRHRYVRAQRLNRLPLQRFFPRHFHPPYPLYRKRSQIAILFDRLSSRPPSKERRAGRFAFARKRKNRMQFAPGCAILCRELSMTTYPLLQRRTASYNKRLRGSVRTDSPEPILEILLSTTSNGNVAHIGLSIRNITICTNQ